VRGFPNSCHPMCCASTTRCFLVVVAVAVGGHGHGQMDVLHSRSIARTPKPKSDAEDDETVFLDQESVSRGDYGSEHYTRADAKNTRA
jgi:hypothetical protein